MCLASSVASLTGSQHGGEMEGEPAACSRGQACGVASLVTTYFCKD